jgi:RNA polymerase sigma-70 factor (ECF subfamily)
LSRAILTASVTAMMPEPPPAATPGAPPAETALIARLHAGDGAAFEQVVRSHTGQFLGVCRRMLGNEDDAREAVQDAFLSAFRSLQSYHGEARLSTWLYRIVVNSALMKLRSRRCRRETPIDDLLPGFDDTGHHVDPPAQWSEPVDGAMLRQETKDLIRRMIDRLPETYRTVLMLRDIEELDTAATAAVLGVTENAVKIRLHRARQALRTLLDPHLRRADA